MISRETSIIIILLVLLILGAIYMSIYITLYYRVKTGERYLLDLFRKKTSKIPALIEVMRPLVSKSEAFAPMTRMHTQIMIEEYRSIYDILENNARLESEFLFLMNLSSRIPPLQKHEYFLYIRDFMIDYDLRMRTSLQDIDTSIAMWNRFISIKNKTLIGYLLPGSSMASVKGV